MEDGMVVDITWAFREADVSADTVPGSVNESRMRPMTRLIVLDFAKIFIRSLL